MKRKLQIFISSTFSDLQAERQAAVEAILRAGHIPAGMELFSAGSESQLEVVKRWIDESDVYMLILGGRYGSIEAKSTLSYTEIEYRYAVEQNKPVFAIVATNNLIEQKVKALGLDVVERKSIPKYDEFRTLVLSKICRFFDDVKEIKISIFESLLDIQDRYKLKGWVKFDEVPDLAVLINQIASLQEEIDGLKSTKNDNSTKTVTASDTKQKYLYGGLTYLDLASILEGRKVDFPATAMENKEKMISNYFSAFISNAGTFNVGIKSNNALGSGGACLYKIASELMMFGLIDQSYAKEGQNNLSILRTSSDGMKFIAEYHLKSHKHKISKDDKKKGISTELEIET